jgi:hypothetical protein
VYVPWPPASACMSSGLAKTRPLARRSSAESTTRESHEFPPRCQTRRADRKSALHRCPLGGASPNHPLRVLFDVAELPA